MEWLFPILNEPTTWNIDQVPGRRGATALSISCPSSIQAEGVQC
jgi:hypothetical protein